MERINGLIILCFEAQHKQIEIHFKLEFTFDGCYAAKAEDIYYLIRQLKLTAIDSLFYSRLL